MIADLAAVAALRHHVVRPFGRVAQVAARSPDPDETGIAHDAEDGLAVAGKDEASTSRRFKARQRACGEPRICVVNGERHPSAARERHAARAGNGPRDRNRLAVRIECAAVRANGERKPCIVRYERRIVFNRAERSAVKRQRRRAAGAASSVELGLGHRQHSAIRNVHFPVTAAIAEVERAQDNRFAAQHVQRSRGAAADDETVALRLRHFILRPRPYRNRRGRARAIVDVAGMEDRSAGDVEVRVRGCTVLAEIGGACQRPRPAFLYDRRDGGSGIGDIKVAVRPVSASLDDGRGDVRQVSDCPRKGSVRKRRVWPDAERDRLRRVRAEGELRPVESVRTGQSERSLLKDSLLRAIRAENERPRALLGEDTGERRVHRRGDTGRHNDFRDGN